MIFCMTNPLTEYNVPLPLFLRFACNTGLTSAYNLPVIKYSISEQMIVFHIKEANKIINHARVKSQFFGKVFGNKNLPLYPFTDICIFVTVLGHISFLR